MPAGRFGRSDTGSLRRYAFEVVWFDEGIPS